MSFGYCYLLNFGCLSSDCLMSFDRWIGFDPFLDFARKECRSEAEDQTEESEYIDNERSGVRAVLTCVLIP
jgi:hypothetical protein